MNEDLERLIKNFYKNKVNKCGSGLIERRVDIKGNTYCNIRSKHNTCPYLDKTDYVEVGLRDYYGCQRRMAEK
jgi:hypothetical protein